ncbi:class I SAM-dependent methyltransferase [Virgibacillus sp. LDC-1]|uniref:SAM-dependent methyltransferase n=1 Tax=Virgibacillus sp. LDC-1 TaxID=3039856 RepID=UPI0024DE6C31|nr:class I SAM-dependent methyltransferase [Virgibacillus sp. LDC-1]
MNWVNNFYEKQFSILKDGSKITAYHKNLVTELEKQVNKPIQTILELGAGSGELAITAAQEGYHVTAIELIPSIVKHMEEQAKQTNLNGSLTPICGDFYTVDVPASFDVVLYLDGFGVGSDQDQKRLLQRIASWLKPDGCALIDIYSPWYWIKAAGQQMKIGEAFRKYDYDSEEMRMIDTWWTDSEEEAFYQSLRCYGPADLKLLLENTGLELVGFIPGGGLDYDTMEYHEKLPLNEAMSYRVKLMKR